MIKNFIVRFLSQKLTSEEKTLCLVPVLGMYVDLIITFIASGNPTSLLALEFNIGLKQAITSGPTELFIYVLECSLTIFLLFTLIIYILKFIKINIKVGYAIIFVYYGMRVNGALSWLV
jgi:hypothetical protein